MKNRGMLDKVVNICSKIVGERQTSMTELYESRVMQKARRIECDSSHVLAQFYEKLPSGRRFRVPKYRLLRTKSSFISKSIQFLNNH